MTTVRRNGRPNRPWRTRGARTGMVALLALGAGVGCGQPALRTQGGAGPLAEPTLSRMSFWEHSPGRQANAAAVGKRAAPGPVAIDSGVAEAANEKLNGGITLATFDGSTFARTTWNGWKVPENKAKPAANVAATEAPAAVSTANPGAESAPPMTVAAAEIPPPARRSPGAVAESGTSLDALVAACRSTKIAPPMLAPPASKVSAPVEAQVEPPQAADSPVAATGPPAPAEPAVSEVVAAPATAPEPKAETGAAPAVAVAAEPAPARSDEALKDLPSLAEQEPADKNVAPAVIPLETVRSAAEPAAVDVPPAPTTRTASAPTSTPRPSPAPDVDPLKAACEATSIEPPRRPVVATGMPMGDPLANPTMVTPLTAAVANEAPGQADAGDPLMAASRATSIPMPVRPSPGTDTLNQASRATSIPLPSPPRGDR